MMERNYCTQVYGEALYRIQTNNSKAGKILCAYAADIDIVALIDPTILQAMVAKHLVQLEKELPVVIDTPEELVAVIVHCFAAGRGGEWQVSDRKLIDWLAQRFSGRESLGGTGAIAASYLGGLGFDVVLHVPSLSSRQAALIPSYVRIPRKGVLKEPAEAVIASADDMVHFILEYREGMSLELPSGVVSCPRSNRLIITYDPANARLDVDRDFCHWVNAHANEISGAVISGYNLASPDIYEVRIREIEREIKQWRSAGPGGMYHYEGADTKDNNVKEYIVKEILPGQDSIGINEDELIDFAKVFDIPVPDLGSIQSTLSVMRRLYDKLNPGRLNLHTAHYSVTIGQVKPYDEQLRMAAGCLTGAHRAKTGGFATLEELRLLHQELPVSTTGLARVSEMGVLTGSENGIYTEGGLAIALLPSRVVKDPKCMVGLGDAYCAGVVAGSIPVNNRTILKG